MPARLSVAAAVTLAAATLAGCGSSSSHTAPKISAPSVSSKVPDASGLPTPSQTSDSSSDGSKSSNNPSDPDPVVSHAPEVTVTQGSSPSDTSDSSASASSSGANGRSGSLDNARDGDAAPGGGKVKTWRTGTSVVGRALTAREREAAGLPFGKAAASYTPRSDTSRIVEGSRAGSGAATGIAIPSLGLNRSIRHVGLSRGVLQPPAGTVGWYTGNGRVTPGQNGIAVLLGHVTYSGPDVFYRLSTMHAGDKVIIRYANGGTRTFVAYSKFSIDKDAMEHDARIWGSSKTPVVALVTCDAHSGWESSTHHRNNYVVLLRPA